jgi:hypothetical protein
MAIRIQGTTVIDDSRQGTLVGLDLTGTGAIKLPVGTTDQRPTAATGQLRFNSETANFEGYNGVEWGAIAGSGGGGGADEYARTLALAAL